MQFFSFVMDENGDIFYFNREQRLAHLANNPNDSNLDSFDFICDFFNLNKSRVLKLEYLTDLKFKKFGFNPESWHYKK